MEEVEPVTSAFVALKAGQGFGLFPFQLKSGIYEVTRTGLLATSFTVIWFTAFTYWYASSSYPYLLLLKEAAPSFAIFICLCTVQFTTHVFVWLEVLLILVKAKKLKKILSDLHELKMSKKSLESLRRNINKGMCYIIITEGIVCSLSLAQVLSLHLYYFLMACPVQLLMTTIDIVIDGFIAIPPGLINYVNCQLQNSLQAKDFTTFYQLQALHGRSCALVDQLSSAFGTILLVKVLVTFILTVGAFVLAIALEPNDVLPTDQLALDVVLILVMAFARLHFISSRASDPASKVNQSQNQHAFTKASRRSCSSYIEETSTETCPSFFALQAY
jgi:hypothetical protein